jgi:diphosphomevalonate decarboxylase
MYENAKLILDTSSPVEGSVTWRSPSNIALIKYWGKYGNQLPKNPSVSFTLDEAQTLMRMHYNLKKAPSSEIDLRLFFGQVHNEDFESKVKSKLSHLVHYFPFLKQLDLEIETANTFPHSAGIASSASSMSALALCLCTMEHELFGTLDSDEMFDQKASYIARLLSGSAARSVYGYCALWGEVSDVPGSSPDYAISMEANLHPVFKSYHNSILIVHSGEKAVSSSAGHKLMEDNPFSEPRYTQARLRMAQMLRALNTGDLEHFIQLTEQEALALHALMMLSNPPYILMVSSTLEIIRQVQAFRADTGIPVCFTLDAGPNIHLLYPDEHQETMNDFIITALSPLCQDGLFIADKIGEGPEQL